MITAPVMKEVKTPQMMTLRTSWKITSFKECACPWRIGESIFEGRIDFSETWVEIV